MNTEVLLTTVAEWLRGTALPDLTPREQPVPGPDDLKRVLAVVGPRRAGKTYFLYQMLAGLLRTGATRHDILFVDFEDFRLREFQPEDMDRLLAAFYQTTGRAPRHLFFDEVQRIPEWSRVLRTLLNSRKYTLVVTGSNARLLGSEIATELRGRYEDRLILPFSFREYLRLRGIAWDRALAADPARGIIVKALDDYLQNGGFPEAAGLPDESARRRLMQSYFDTVFYKDVLDRHGIRARHLLDLIMRGMLEAYAAPFSISAFERRLKAHGQAGSKRSIAEYLRSMEEAFFIVTTEKFDYSPRKRMMNPRKVYLMDTGFALLGGAFTANRGRLLENVAAVEFIRNRRRILHFKGRHECDFIVQDGARPVEAWQVCWELHTGNAKREVGGLLEAWSTLKIKTGGILTYNQEEQRTVDGIIIPVRPVWKWLLDPEM
ncbi:MAG: ATP-binding protein [Planctomycetota bacterium]